MQMKGKHPGVEYLETVVSLVRQETGFGFRIVGGTEEGSQVGGTVSIFYLDIFTSFYIYGPLPRCEGCKCH